MSGGHEKTTSENRVLSASERANLFNSQLGLFTSALGNQRLNTAPRQYATSSGMQSNAGMDGGTQGANGGLGWAADVAGGDTATAGAGLGMSNAGRSRYMFDAPTYDSQSYVGAGDMRTLTGGDYDALQKALVERSSAPLQRAEMLQRQGVDQSAADRGIWSSGLAMEAQNQLTEALAPQYASIGAGATAQRYAMQSAEQQALNQAAINDAAQRNAFNTEQAAQNYASDWAPLQYLQQLYAQTGGQVGADNKFSTNAGFQF